MSHRKDSHPARAADPSPTGVALALLASLLCLCGAGCKAFKIDVGTSEPLKLDPIKFEPIDINMNVDIYQYTGSSKTAAKTATRTEAQAIEGMRNRMGQVKILKNSRWVGENHLGRLSIRHLPAGSDGTWTQKVVNDENADRDVIMMATAKRDNTPIEEVRTKHWKNNVQSAWEGVLVQIEGETKGDYVWVQKSEDDSEWIKPQNPDGVDKVNPVLDEVIKEEQDKAEAENEEGDN